MHFLETTQKNIVLLAPTGVAALNIWGATLHSFFGFPPTLTLKKARQEAKFQIGDPKFTELDTIVIDEISMVRADMMDCIHEFLKIVRSSSKPFGGVQLIMIGDLYQLPPVVTKFEKEFFQKEYRRGSWGRSIIQKRPPGSESSGDISGEFVQPYGTM